MSTNLHPSACRRVSSVLPPADKTAAVTKVRCLERQLVDDDGCIRRNVTPAHAEVVIARINDLRQALGWLQIDIHGQWRWPTGVDSVVTSHRPAA